MRFAMRVALLAVGVAGPVLDAQECPRRAVQPIRPSLRGPVELAGTYEAPFEFVCGRPLTVRVHQEGTVLTAVAQAPPGCAAAQRVRWRGEIGAGQTSFPVQVAQRGAELTAGGTATLIDPCTIAVTMAGRAGAARYRRTDGACAESGAPRPVVAFIGGALDDWNRNLQRVYCAYDAQWEGTHKLYFLHTDDPVEVRRRIRERAAGSPVALVGHSYGANFAYELANTLRDDGGVALLLTLDPVSGPAAPRVPLEPGATRRWINVWAGSGVGLSSCGLAGAIGGAWGSRPEADVDLRFPPDPAKDSPSVDHCKTEEMFLLQPVQEALAELR